MKEVGLNLFSLRSFIKTEESFLDTALRLKKMGYTFLQYSGAPFDAPMIKRVSDATGMPVVLTHVPLDRIVGDTEALMGEHSLFGCNNIGLGSVPASVSTVYETLVPQVAALEKAASRMYERGFRFYYHNHHYEFFKHNGKTVLDYMIENAPHVSFTLDTYWVQYGGGDIADYVQRLSGRIGCVHLKDYRIVTERDERSKLICKPRFCPVGDGNINFKKLVPLMREAGTKYFIVEQDNAVDFDDPFAQVEASVRYIREEI